MSEITPLGGNPPPSPQHGYIPLTGEYARIVVRLRGKVLIEAPASCSEPGRKIWLDTHLVSPSAAEWRNWRINSLVRAARAGDFARVREIEGLLHG